MSCTTQLTGTAGENSTPTLPENNAGSGDSTRDALISRLQEFLLKLDRGFAFVGRHYRMSTETSRFYADLVFYNYSLRCFVVIDVKRGPLTRQALSQTDMYRRMFDDLKKQEGDNPTIGITLFADKDKAVVKCSVLQECKAVFAAKYAPLLPTEAEINALLSDAA